jgi:hypothetical protein
VSLALRSDGPALQHDALASAALLGDWDSYTELARSAFDNESIAWLCLRDPEAGRPEAHARVHGLHAQEREANPGADPDHHGQEIALWHLALITQLGLDEDVPGLDLERAEERAGERTPRSSFLDHRGPQWTNGELAELLVVARDPELARRWRALRVRPPIPSGRGPAVAVGRMIASWAHDPSAEELWLDLALPYAFPLGRQYYELRAELARWRGDAEAEQRWRDRRASLATLAQSHEHELLLHLAGF